MNYEHPLMPNFKTGTYGFHHTVDSALTILHNLGVPDSQITIQTSGPQRSPLQVTEQKPAPGTALSPSVPITIVIAGFGIFRSLPVGMWYSGHQLSATGVLQRDFGTREFFELLDDPLEKAAHWVREGSRLFDIGPKNLGACRRWLSLFAISADLWPNELLYPLALLAPSLVRLAGREVGIRLAFAALFDLPVAEVRLRKTDEWSLSDRELSRLGDRYTRMGRDLVLGGRKDALELEVFLGPVTLETYDRFQLENNNILLRSALNLIITIQQSCRISWIVADTTQAPHLCRSHEHGPQNARLGVNTHLGVGRTR